MRKKDYPKWLRLQVDTGVILDETGYPSKVDFCSAIFFKLEWVEELNGIFYMPYADISLSLN